MENETHAGLSGYPHCALPCETGTNELAEGPSVPPTPEPGYANKCPACAVVPAWGFLAASEFIQSPLQLPAMLVVM